MSLLKPVILSKINVDSDPLGLNSLSSGIYPEDVGKKWKDLGVIASGRVRSMAYCGNGIVLLGDGDGNVCRSTDYGATWSDLGEITTLAIYAMVYCGNGIVLLGGRDDHVWRSDCAFKTDECASESAISQATPASAAAAGHKGEIRWDADFIYVCIADDTWERVAIASW